MMFRCATLNTGISPAEERHIAVSLKVYLPGKELAASSRILLEAP